MPFPAAYPTAYCSRFCCDGTVPDDGPAVTFVVTASCADWCGGDCQRRVRVFRLGGVRYVVRACGTAAPLRDRDWANLFAELLDYRVVKRSAAGRGKGFWEAIIREVARDLPKVMPCSAGGNQDWVSADLAEDAASRLNCCQCGRSLAAGKSPTRARGRLVCSVECGRALNTAGRSLPAAPAKMEDVERCLRTCRKAVSLVRKFLGGNPSLLSALQSLAAELPPPTSSPSSCPD